MPPEPAPPPSALGACLAQMALEAVRLQHHLDADWEAARAAHDATFAPAPGTATDPLAQALHHSLKPARQRVGRYTVALSCELALTRRREASILVRPLPVGYAASSTTVTASSCRLRLEIEQTTPTPPLPREKSSVS